MSKRRPSGDGMVRKREDGRWEGRLVIGHNKDGSSIFRFLSARTQKELLEKLHRCMEEYQGVDLTEDCKRPLRDWLEQWLEEYAQPSVRASTLNGYRTELEHYVIPYLGDKPVGKLTKADMQNLYQTLAREGRVHPGKDGATGLSAATIRKVHGALHQAMTAARQSHLIARDPTEGVTLPKKETAPMEILNDEQLEKFLGEADRDPAWRDFFYTELTTGLRQGEICGLRWTDFNERKGTLHVCRTIHARQGGQLVAGETKTGAGKRTITLSPSTAERLRERRKASVSEWIFYDPISPEKPVRPSAAYAKMKALLKQAGLPDIKFHALRHTFATHALASGVDAKTLSHILGHTRASFTLDTYAHVTGDMHRRAAGIVGNMMNELEVT